MDLIALFNSINQDKLGAVIINIIIFTIVFSMFDDDDFEGDASGIINRMYFTVVSATTVGYGDVYPKSPACRLMVVVYLMIMFMISIA